MLKSVKVLFECARLHKKIIPLLYEKRSLYNNPTVWNIITVPYRGYGNDMVC